MRALLYKYRFFFLALVFLSSGTWAIVEFIEFRLGPKDEEKEETIDCASNWVTEHNVLIPECVNHYFQNSGPAILFVFEAAESHRERARENTLWSSRYLNTTQILVIIIGAVATLMVAFGDVILIRGRKIGPWAVILTTTVTVLTSISTYFDWRGERIQQYILAQDMATLRSQMNLDLLLAIDEGQFDNIGGDDVKDYVREAHARIDEYLRLYQTDALQRMNRAEIGASNR